MPVGHSHMEVTGDFDKGHCVAMMGMVKALLGEHSTEKVGGGKVQAASRDALPRCFTVKGLKIERKYSQEKLF